MQIWPTFEWDSSAYLFLFFCFIAFLHVLFVAIMYGRLAFFRQPSRDQTTSYPPVSIILAARNESDNLYENLPLLLQQDYPCFEVIVINNQSVDDSAYLLSAYRHQYANLHVIEVAKSKHISPGKKLPITLGVKGAKYEHLLLTDADCKPTSNQWIKHMASSFSDKKSIVLGYGPYQKTKGFLNALVRFDTAWIGINYFSMALAGAPFMGVGRNLGYTKSIFNKVHGFKSHYSLPSGDDDLFIQEAAKDRNYGICIHPDAHCYSDAPENWNSYFRQKSRHYTTSDQYQVFKKALLGIYPLTLLMLLLSFVILLVNTQFHWVSTFVFIGGLVVKWWLIGRCFRKLNERRFVLWFPLWDIYYSLFIPLLFYTSERKDKKQW
jgi:cellulose synthase/poly-beta-1,6-N-acetylglucosamine synthase-like glycosyltransferase